MPDCRRAFEIDLFAFLEDPRAAEFADFRAHYPRCRVCAREVRAWSELHARLAAGAPEATSSAAGPSAHPAPERLLRFADATPALDPAEVRRLEAHLAGCPSCRDELAALGHATARHGAAPAPGEGVGARRSLAASVRELLATLGRLAWHPAVAYGALLLLLGPVLYAQWEGGPPLATPSTEASAPPSASRPAMQAKGRDSAEGEAAPSPSEGDELPSASPGSPPFELAPRTSEGPSGEGTRGVPPPSEEPRRTGDDFADAHPTAEAFRDRAPGARRAEPEARSETAEDAAPSPQLLERSDVLAETTPRLEPVPDEPEVLRLHVPVPPGAGATEVRLVSPDGRRALVEHFDAPDGTVALRLPRSWLTPGAHRLEIRTPRGRRELPLEVPARLLRVPEAPAKPPGSDE